MGHSAFSLSALMVNEKQPMVEVLYYSTQQSMLIKEMLLSGCISETISYHWWYLIYMDLFDENLLYVNMYDHFEWRNRKIGRKREHIFKTRYGLLYFHYYIVLKSQWNEWKNDVFCIFKPVVLNLISIPFFHVSEIFKHNEQKII